MANQLDETLGIHSHALNLRAYRQQVLASNIANADTPGYQARDVDFSKALQAAVGGRMGTVTLATTSPQHIAGSRSSNQPELQYRSVVQPSIDDNTVDMDVERAQFVDNAVHYEASLTFINGPLKKMLSAIQG